MWAAGNENGRVVRVARIFSWKDGCDTAGSTDSSRSLRSRRVLRSRLSGLRAAHTKTLGWSSETSAYLSETWQVTSEYDGQFPGSFSCFVRYASSRTRER